MQIKWTLTPLAEQELNVDCGEAGKQLDLEIEKILYKAEQHALDYLRQYTIADGMDSIYF